MERVTKCGRISVVHPFCHILWTPLGISIFVSSFNYFIKKSDDLLFPMINFTYSKKLNAFSGDHLWVVRNLIISWNFSQASGIYLIYLANSCGTLHWLKNLLVAALLHVWAIVYYTSMHRLLSAPVSYVCVLKVTSILTLKGKIESFTLTLIRWLII